MTTTSDDELVLLLQQGEKTAMGELYLRYQPRVFAKCFSFLKNKEEARDFTQEIMLKVMEKINSFKGDSKFSTWLFSITYNYCTDQLRKGKGKFTESIESCLNLKDESCNDVDFLMEEESKICRINKIMLEIPPEDQQLLVMKYQFNKSIQELQLMYQLSASAVKMGLMRAREKAGVRFRLQTAA